MTRVGTLLVAAFLVLVGCLTAIAFVNAWSNGQNASTVLGQTNFTSATGGSGNSGFSQSLGVAVDPASGKVFVSDTAHHRVMRFSSAQAATTGGVAEAVIGQPDFATITAGITQTKMNSPIGIQIDSAGSLWVADQGNNRVTRWDNAATVASGTAAASQVLGQAVFTTNAQNTSQTGMTLPTNLFVDPSGRLYVTDQINHRVLRFDNAATLGNGAPATVVLGQPDFVTSTAAATQTKMAGTTGITGDSNGHVWVCDHGNNRVLRFDNAGAKTNGAPADGVLGQTLFTTNTSSTTQTTMNVPAGVGVDDIGRLYVSDSSNNRVLVFNGAATKVNGAPADNVLGQTTFTAGASNLSQSGFNFPWSVATSPGSNEIYVPDSNNRVLHFIAAGPTAAGVTVSGRVMTPDGRGLRNATVVLIDEKGNAQRIRTTALGSYRFVGIAAGQTYVLAIESNTYRYSPRVLSVDGEMAGLDFVPTANARGKAH